MGGPRGTDLDVVVVGGANTEYRARAEALLALKHSGSFMRGVPGGRGVAQALSIAQLGGCVALLASIGADARGDDVLRTLTRGGVETLAVHRDDAVGTGSSFFAVEASGEAEAIWNPGANERLTGSVVRTAADLLAASKAVLLQLEVPLEAVRAAIRIARGARVPVVLDPTPPVRLPADVLRSVCVLRPSAVAASVLTGIEVTDRDDARAAAERMFLQGARAVCVGAPRGDLLVLEGEGEMWLPHVVADTVETTGMVGDVFAGALALALAEGAELPAAVRFAHVSTALVLARPSSESAQPS